MNEPWIREGGVYARNGLRERFRVDKLEKVEGEVAYVQCSPVRLDGERHRGRYGWTGLLIRGSFSPAPGGRRS